MIYILLGNGFEECEALVPLDLLRRAGAKVTLVGVDGLEVTGGHGVTVKADISMDDAHDPEDMEMLVLPGGLGGVEAIQKNQFALALIQKAYDRGCWLCAICAAPTILAREGCLDRRKAVCYPGMEDEMGSAVGLSGSPQGGVLPRHGGRDGLRRGAEGRPGGDRRPHHHRRGGRLRL